MSHYDNYDDLIGLGLINIEMKNFESGLSLFIKKSLLDLTADNIYFKMIYKLDDLAKRFKLDDSELTEVQKSENNIYKQYFELNKSNSVNPSKLISELKNIDKEIDDSSVNVESLYKEYAGYFS